MDRNAERDRLKITTPVDPKHDEKYGHLANDDTANLAKWQQRFKHSDQADDPTIIEARKAIAAELKTRGQS